MKIKFLLFVLLFFWWIVRPSLVLGACSGFDWCNTNEDCPWNSHCSLGTNCCISNGGTPPSTACNSAASPACNGWCAAGTSCQQDGAGCSCVTGGGGGCSTTSPQAVNLNSPVNGTMFNSGTASVTLLWDPLTISQWGTNSCGMARQYRVLVSRDGGSYVRIDTINDGPDADSLPDANSTTYTLPVTTSGTEYAWYVVSNNGNDSTFSETWTFSLATGVGGTVYVVPDSSTCSTTSPTNIGGALSATWDGTTTVIRRNLSTGQTISSSTGAQSVSAAVGGLGQFLVAPSRGTQCRNVGPQIQECTTYSATGTLSIATIPADYSCATACGSCPRTGVNSNSSGNNFFYAQTLNRVAWWQVEGAGIYAGSPSGESVKSLLPLATTRLIKANGTANAGALVKLSTTPANLGTNSGELSDENWSAISKYQGKRMDYAYFAVNMGLTGSKTSDWSDDNLTKLTYDANKEFYYMKPTSGTATITSDWTLASPEKYVVFVDGDLRIAANVTIPVGQFAAFIVKGNIIIEPAVTSMAGLFVTNGIFQTEHVASGDDVQLTTQGSVVSWSGLSLGRDLGNGNAAEPAEKFVYRPDFLVNMPDAMKSFSLNWKEVAPGTFE